MDSQNTSNGKVQIIVAIIGAIVAIVVACIAHFSFKPTQPQQQDVTINGTIADQISNDPISNARVLVIGTSINTTSDNDGSFTFKLHNFKDSSITFRILENGYPTQDYSYSLNGDIKIMLVKRR